MKLGREFLKYKSNNCHESLDTWNYQQSLFLLRKGRFILDGRESFLK